MFLSLYACLPSLFALWHNVVSSLVHHRFVFGQILVIGTTLDIVSCIVGVSFLHAEFSWGCIFIHLGMPSFARHGSSVFLKQSQSMSQKLCSSVLSASVVLRSKVVSIGRWLVFMPCHCAYASHEISMSEE